MRVKVMGFCLIMLAVASFLATGAWADCPPGKTEATIVPPAGNVTTHCIPKKMADLIGGSSAIVITATCPCWKEELMLWIPRTLCSLAPEYFPSCSATAPGNPDPGAILDNDPVASCLPIDDFIAKTVYSAELGTGFCWSDDFYTPEILVEDLTRNEVEACRAFLLRSEMWALNCGGS